LKTLFFQNIIAPYKTLLFNALARKDGGSFLVVYLAETAGNREWKIDKEEIEFPYEVISEGREEDAGRWKSVSKAWNLLERHTPEVVVVGGYNYAAFWVAHAWAKIRKRKSLIIVESHYLDRTRRSIRERMKRAFVSRFDAALVDGTRHRDYAVSLGMPPERVFIKFGTGPIDVGMYDREVARIRPGKAAHCRSLGIPPKNFLYVGRFSVEKNLMALLRAFGRLRKDGFREWGLIMVGDGPQRRDIERFVREGGLEGVFLPGFKQRREVPLYYALSDVFILPSLSEPWGLVVVEAMASGLPVLVSDRCGCFPDAVREGVNGFSFDPNRDRSLSEKMKDIAMGRHDLAGMGARSREMAAAFTPEKAAEVYARAVEFALKGDPCMSH